MKKVLPLYADLPTPAEMQQWDAVAHSLFGIPPLLLMENAAQAALRELKSHISLSSSTKVLIVMGRGNNGGDGAALARLLYDEGCNVLVCCTEPLNNMSDEAKTHLEMARRLGVNFLAVTRDGAPLLPTEWSAPQVVVDAIAGTGLHGELRSDALALVRAVNAYRDTSFILSLDIPSGLCGYSGVPRPEAVRAHATVTFEAGKPGLFFPEAREYTGTITVRRVGIPQAARAMILPTWRLLTPNRGAWPPPSALRHKGEAGKVLIIGGSEGMTGAPVLAGLGCLRAGAGLAHVLVPGDLAESCRSGWPELLVHGAGAGRVWKPEHEEDIRACMNLVRPDALVLGPGMGRTAAVGGIVRALLEDSDRPPVVLDADALYFFRSPEEGPDREGTARSPASDCSASPILPLSLLGPEDLLTPHPGELARMLPPEFFAAVRGEDGPPPDLRARTVCVQRNRIRALEACIALCPAVVVLKGAGTLIGRQGAPTALAPFATAALGVGGSGDVLSGLCAALLAQGIDAIDAAGLGVYLHGRAGELLGAHSPLGHLAREIADAVTLVWNELCGR